LKAAGVLALVLASWLSFCAAAAQTLAPDLARAQSLLREGRGADAYTLLEKHEAQAAGEAEFDYWLGISALEAGKPDKATIALERALIVNPDYVGARLDLARAYFALGDFDRARLEFKTVLEQDPPPAARRTIDRYLAEMEAQRYARLRRWTAYIEAALGHDTNVNTSTRDTSVFVPLFGLNLALAPTSVKLKDNYGSVGAGGEYLLPLTDSAALFAGIDYRHRLNFQEDLFDQYRFDVRGGVQLARGPNLIRAGATYGRFYLDNRWNYESTGLALEWRRALDERNALTLIGLRNRLRYPDPLLAGNDADQIVFGAGFGHAYNAEATTFVFASVYGGHEDDRNNRVDGQRRLYGGRLVGQYSLREGLEAYATAAAQWSDYDVENFVFQATRQDRYYELALGLIWRFERDWSLRPQITYIRNQSNIAIYDYDRYDVSLTVRRDFR